MVLSETSWSNPAVQQVAHIETTLQQKSKRHFIFLWPSLKGGPAQAIVSPK
jgi:hypothetical protein